MNELRAAVAAASDARAEEDLRARNEELSHRVQQQAERIAALNKEMEVLGHSLAHDLRAPLRSIAGFTDIVLEESRARLDPEALGHLQRVRNAAARMATLIDAFVTLTRASRGRPERSRVDLTALATAIMAELQASAPERLADVSIAPGMLVHADPGQTKTLLSSLLANAWKFTRNAPRADIAIGTETHEGATVFFVRDYGAGFAMENAGRLFRPFSRLHAEKEFPGAGIGLAIVQRIAQAHGGQVWAEGAEGHGATFRFTLER